MPLGEHVLDFLTGPDVPVRHAVVFHVLHPLRPVLARPLCHNSLPHLLHNGKALFGIHSPVDQINHNVIPAADGSSQGAFSFLDQCLRISQIDICAVRQSGDTA